jgi:outer membrane protein assembly factor BamB
MYDTRIMEFPNLLATPVEHLGEIFLRGANGVMKLASSGLATVAATPGVDSFQFALGGLWVERWPKYLSPGETASIFVDVDGKGVSFPPEPLPLGGARFFGCACAGFNYLVDDDDPARGLFVKDFTEGRFGLLPCEHAKVTVENSGVFARMNLRDLVRFDWALGEQWRVTSSKKCHSLSLEQRPQLYGDWVVLNVGVDPRTRRDFELTAYAKRDGSVVWSQTLDHEPTASTLHDGRVYVSLDAQMLVFDAATGKKLVDRATGFKGQNDIQCLGDDKRIVAWSKPDAAVRVFSADGEKLIQEVKVPYPYAPWRARPLFHANNIYLPVVKIDPVLIGTGGALMILTPAQGKKPVVAVDERPPIAVITVENEQGEHELVVSVSHDNVEELLRYTEIAVKETAHRRGAHMDAGDERDPKHNGRIRVAVDPVGLPPEARAKIETMLRRVERYLEDTRIEAGDSKHKIRITLEM